MKLKTLKDFEEKLLKELAVILLKEIRKDIEEIKDKGYEVKEIIIPQHTFKDLYPLQHESLKYNHEIRTLLGIPVSVNNKKFYGRRDITLITNEKDLATHRISMAPCVFEVIDEKIEVFKELKKEGIKWAKKETKKMNKAKDKINTIEYIGRFQVLCEFFNIEEEDLENG